MARSHRLMHRARSSVHDGDSEGFIHLQFISDVRVSTAMNCLLRFDKLILMLLAKAGLSLRGVLF
jgi:hypothetical protein